jgi:hypothetical protein
MVKKYMVVIIGKIHLVIHQWKGSGSAEIQKYSVPKVRPIRSRQNAIRGREIHISCLAAVSLTSEVQPVQCISLIAEVFIVIELRVKT